MPKNKQIGVLLSGGLDSAALLGHILDKGHTVWPIYIRCGLRWEKSELYWARKLVSQFKTPKLKKLSLLKLTLEDAYHRNWSQTGKTPGAKSADDAVFLPARNLLLITKAFLYLSAKNVNTIALATLKTNPFTDGKKKYFNDFEKILSKSFNQKLKILTPFDKWKKMDVLQKSRQFPLHLSSSCINPKSVYHCGRCNKCAERKTAFRKARISDKTIYARG